MVNRHIEHLFGGDVCVVAGRFNGQNPYDKPVFERRRRFDLSDIARAPFALVSNRLTYGTLRLPFGRRKRELAAFLRAERVEAILAEFGTQAVPVAPLAHELGIPVFSYFRGTDASKSLRQPGLVAAYRKCIPYLDGIFAVSQFLIDNLARHGIVNANAHVVPSGVNVRLFRPADKAATSCIAVGRMVEKKAPLVTIRAFASAARDIPGARLTMIGDGPLLAPAQALVDSLGMRSRITLLGARPHAEVREHMAASEVFLQHSVTAGNGNAEGVPTAIQEAMACGCVVISTRHAGIPEIVSEGETGYLVDEHDEAGYTAHLASVLRGDRRGDMGRRARQVAKERLDNDMLLRRLEQYMTEAVARRRAGAGRTQEKTIA